MFDAHGGFWFTDHGKVDYAARCHDIVGIFYAKVDGSFIEEVIFPSYNPNGIGLSPDGTKLYAADTYNCRLTQLNIGAKIGNDTDRTPVHKAHSASRLHT